VQKRLDSAETVVYERHTFNMMFVARPEARKGAQHGDGRGRV
jgi:hypothetical protein